MKLTALSVSVLSLACVLALNAPAAELGASAKLGTLGFGADVCVGINAELGARLGVNIWSMTMPINDEETAEAGEVEIELRLLSVPVFLDWHPKGGSFRVSGGLILNNNRIAVTADEDDLVDIGDDEYRITDLSGEITFNALAPYIGIGFGNVIGEGTVVFACDIGVMYQGSPHVTLNATANNAAIQEQLDEDLQKEEENLEDEAKSMVLYPVLNAGVLVRF